MPIASGSVLQELHSPLPRVVQPYVAKSPRTTRRRQCGGLLQEFDCPRPKSGEAMRGRISTAH